MELIPILSTIILVATISTFLLAIGAYILYKIRERRGKQVVKVAEPTVEAELITPEGAPAQQKERKRTQAPRPSPYEQPVGGGNRPSPQPIFINNTTQQPPSPSFTRSRNVNVPVNKQGVNVGSARFPYSQNQRQGYQGPSYAAPGRASETPPRDTRFVQYTTEGYVKTKEDKNKETLKWR